MLQEVLAIVATVLVTASYIPQIAKAYVTKSMKDVSMLFLLILALSIFIWVIYGFLRGDVTFLIANIIIFFLASTLICMKLYYDKLRKA